MVSTRLPSPGVLGSLCCASSPGWLGPGSPGKVKGLLSDCGPYGQLDGYAGPRRVERSHRAARTSGYSWARQPGRSHSIRGPREEQRAGWPLMSSAGPGGGGSRGLMSFCSVLSCHLRRAESDHGDTWARRPQGRTHVRKPSGYQLARRPLGRVLASVLCLSRPLLGFCSRCDSLLADVLFGGPL